MADRQPNPDPNRQGLRTANVARKLIRGPTNKATDGGICTMTRPYRMVYYFCCWNVPFVIHFCGGRGAIEGTRYTFFIRQMIRWVKEFYNPHIIGDLSVLTFDVNDQRMRHLAVICLQIVNQNGDAWAQLEPNQRNEWENLFTSYHANYYQRWVLSE